MSHIELNFSKNSLNRDYFIPLSECCLILNLQQRKAFLRYLNSPYFNTDPLVTDLFDRIIKANKRNSKSMRIKKILSEWERKTNKKATEEELKEKVKRLYKFVQDFIVQDHLQQTRDAYLSVLQDALSNKGTSYAFRQVVNKRKEGFVKLKPGIEQLHSNFWLNHQTYFELGTNYEKKGFSLVNELQQQLQEINNLLVAIYDCETTSSPRLSNNVAYPAQPTITTTDHILTLFKQAQQLILLKEFSQDSLDQFTAVLYAMEDKLAATEKLLLCKTVINVLSINNTSISHPLDEQLHYWIKKSVEWTPESISHIGPNNYLNAVMSSCGCGDFEFAKAFQKKHANVVQAETRLLGDAYYYFFQNDFAKAINILESHFVPTPTYDFFYTLRTHFLLYRAYLAQDIYYDIASEKLPDLEDRCRHYMNRKENSLNDKKHLAYSNFLYFGKKMSNLYHYKNELGVKREGYLKKVEELKAEIIPTRPLQFGSWLYRLAQKLE